jgi:divalent metal cation (Fe/Co/Zn/Cd) transporter
LITQKQIFKTIIILRILVEKSLNAVEAHQISDKVEGVIRNFIGPETIVTVHIEPYNN